MENTILKISPLASWAQSAIGLCKSLSLEVKSDRIWSFLRCVPLTLTKWKSFRFLHCWERLGSHHRILPVFHWGLSLVDNHFPRRKGSPCAKAAATEHAATAAPFSTGSWSSWSWTGVKPPWCSGLHFESGSGFVASHGRCSPAVSPALREQWLGAEEWQEMHISLSSWPRWEEWEALALWKGSIIHEGPHRWLHVLTDQAPVIGEKRVRTAVLSTCFRRQPVAAHWLKRWEEIRMRNLWGCVDVE